MMRYLLLIQINPDAGVPAAPDERLAEKMGKLLEDMTKAGVLLDTAGLRPIEEATRIRLADGEQTVTRRALHRVKGDHRRLLPSPGEIERGSRRVGLSIPRASRPGLGDGHGDPPVG